MGLKVDTIQNPSSATVNLTLDTSGNVTVGGNLTTTGSLAGNPTTTGTYVMGSSFLRNRIINGDMRIDQRNAGASVTPTANGTYCLDRYRLVLSQASKFAVQRVSTAGTPVGFTNAMLITSLSAYSVLSSDSFAIQQRIEGFNVSDLFWGTASAKAVTLSFWAYSSQGGTFGGSFRNDAGNRSYPFTYSLTANTWTNVSISIAGDTTGTWETGSSTGIEINFGLGVGSTLSGTAGTWASANYLSATGATSVVGTNGATFYITGVQLEVGTVATPFERQIYSNQLAQCQRYYYRNTAPSTGTLLTTSGITQSATSAIAMTQFPVAMRASPTALEQSGTAAHYQVFISSNVACSAVPTFLAANVWYATTTATAASGLGGNLPCWITAANTAAYLGWSAEL